MSIFFDFLRNSLFRSKKHCFLSRISKNVSFWLFFLKKDIWEKGRFFRQKPWTNPFAICRFFSTLLELNFYGQKALFSIQNIKKCFCLAFFAQKNRLGKGRFFQKNHGLTPLQNVDFFDFFRTSLFRSKKLYFLSRISKNLSFWLFWLNKSIKKVDFLRKTMD